MKAIILMLCAMLVGVDCGYLTGASTLHYVLHFLAAFGVGILAGLIASDLHIMREAGL